MKMRSIEKLKEIRSYLKRRAEKRELLKPTKKELIAAQVSKIVTPNDIAAGEYKSRALYEMTRYTGSRQVSGKSCHTMVIDSLAKDVKQMGTIMPYRSKRLKCILAEIHRLEAEAATERVKQIEYWLIANNRHSIKAVDILKFDGIHRGNIKKIMASIGWEPVKYGNERWYESGAAIRSKLGV